MLAATAVREMGFQNIDQPDGMGRAADAFAAHNPAAAVLVARAIVAAPARLLPGLANFGLMLARTISATEPGLARDLFVRLENEASIRPPDSRDSTSRWACTF